MAIYSNPPHAVDIRSVDTTRDAGGGTTNTYITVQSAVPCSIDTHGGSEQDRFDQPQNLITHRVAFLSAVLTTPIVRGMKLIASDGSTYHVKGFVAGRAYGGIPAFVYVDVEQLS